MDVKKLVIGKECTAGRTGTIDRGRRRALARLGLASAGAYVAPTLLALRATAVTSMPVVKIDVAA
jgi:hypothetical protein